MCALQKNLVTVSFGQGEDTKTDPKQLPPTKMLDLQNGIFKHLGALDKRWGYNRLSSVILGPNNLTLTSCVAVNSFQNELLAYDGYNAFSYSQSNSGWLNRGPLVSVIQTEQQIQRNNMQQSSPDSGTLDNVTVHAWEEGGFIRYSVLDVTNNPASPYLLIDQPLYSTQGIHQNFRPKVLPFPAAGGIVVLYTSGTNINFVLINSTYPYVINTAGTVLVSDANNPSYYDATVVNNQLYLTYYSNAGAVRLTYFNALFTNPTTVQVDTLTSQPIGVISVVGDNSNNIWVSYLRTYNGFTVYTANYSADLLTQIHAPTVSITQAEGYIQSVTGIADPSNLMHFFAEANPSFTYCQVIYTATWGGASTVLKRSVGLASKPFIYNNVIYVNAAYDSPFQPTYFTIDQNGNIVGKTNPWLGGGLITNSDWMLPECQQISPGVFQYDNRVKGDPITQAGQLFQFLGVNSTKLNFIQSNQFLSAEMNGCLYTVGGIVKVYDGSRYSEVNYHVYPEGIQAIGSGGGSMDEGNYQYVWTYEYNDLLGNTSFSFPSPVVAITVGAGGAVIFQVPTLRLTDKVSVRIVGYRTTQDGELLFRCTPATDPIYNDPTVDFITYTDKLNDSDLQSQGLCYTQPLVDGNTVLPNNAPPSCSFIASYNNRIFLGGLEDPNTLWFSKQRTIGVPMEFSDENTIQIDSEGGAITALGVYNNALVIFKENAIYTLVGNGPDNTGNNSDFLSPGPISVPTSVGCIDPNSVVLTPVGLLFKSAQGIYLFNGSVEYVGSPVEKYNALTIKSATVIPPQWVVFTTEVNANSYDIPVGTALVYDYLLNQWGTFTNHNATDSCLWLGGSNTFVFATPTGAVYQQATLATATSYNTYSDGPTLPISLSATTAELQFGALQGFQRVYHLFVLGTYYGPHTLQVSVAYDRNPSFTSFTVINIPAPDSVYGIGEDGYYGDGYYGGQPFQYQFRIDLSQQKCQSLRIKIEDHQSVSTGFNQGYSISAISARIGVKGKTPFPSAKQYPNK